MLLLADAESRDSVACPPDGPRAKGKVDNGVKYLKNSFLTGLQFSNLADLNWSWFQLDIWIDSGANVRVHGTARQPGNS